MNIGCMCMCVYVLLTFHAKVKLENAMSGYIRNTHKHTYTNACKETFTLCQLQLCSWVHFICVKFVFLLFYGFLYYFSLRQFLSSIFSSNGNSAAAYLLGEFFKLEYENNVATFFDLNWVENLFWSK